ncbi:MAG: DUF4846 domain-containing protein [Muribaculaceae bacterium]|nr:DUF4846 domain-containing protein [Muribaculaceae bacterium]
MKLTRHHLFYLISVTLAVVICAACSHKQSTDGSDSSSLNIANVNLEKESNSFTPGNTVKTRYELPQGYHRVKTESGSFEEYLQNLPLKPIGYSTHLYDGSLKNRKIATSVIDLDIDSLDLQHSADAIIRLRAEYLYKTGQFDKISYTFTDGFQCDYSKWAQGFRVRSDGNHTRWHKADDKTEDYSYATFREYLRTVFAHTDERTLAKEMKDAKEDEFGIGTVIFDRKNPRNVAIVVDMLERDTIRHGYGLENAEVVLLAQGGKPAQEIEIIRGNGDEFNLFKEGDKDFTERKHSSIWTTPNKGERSLRRQGGRFFSGDYEFSDKINKKYN